MTALFLARYLFLFALLALLATLVRHGIRDRNG